LNADAVGWKCIATLRQDTLPVLAPPHRPLLSPNRFTTSHLIQARLRASETIFSLSVYLLGNVLVLGKAEGTEAGPLVLGTAEGAEAGPLVLGTAEGAEAGPLVLGKAEGV